MELVVRRLTLTGSSRRCWLSLTARASHVSNAPDLSACRLLRRLAVLMVAAVAAVWTQTAVAADPTVSISRPVVRVQTVRLPRSVTNVAVHWRGNASARLRIAVSRDGHRFGRSRPVLLDEVGEGARGGDIYGAVMAAQGARSIRIWSDRPLRRVTVVGFLDRGTLLVSPR